MAATKQPKKGRNMTKKKTSKPPKPEKTKSPRSVPDMLQVTNARDINLRIDKLTAKDPLRPSRSTWAKRVLLRELDKYCD